MKNVTIYHNPQCSKSRQTLTLLEERGITPTIVHYLNSPPSVATLKSLLGMLKITARELLRKNEDAYKALNLSDETLSDATLIHAMHEHPKLIERPIVVVDHRAAIGRPPENIVELLK